MGTQLNGSLDSLKYPASVSLPQTPRQNLLDAHREGGSRKLGSRPGSMVPVNSYVAQAHGGLQVS